jgi:taurine dioxygenase
LPGGASSLADLDDAGLGKVMSEVWRHGLVSVPDQDLSAEELVGLAARLGEPIVLPKCFFVGMREPAHPEVCRVGNLYPGAESAADAAEHPELVIQKAKFGEYWHHDGNFLAPPRHAVLNTLHARVVPATGGATHFLDATAALRAGVDGGPFSHAELAALHRSTLTVSHEWISDFATAGEEDIAPLGMPHVHEAVQVHPVTHEPCLYLPLNPAGLWDTERQEHWAQSAEVWERLERAGYYYEHLYQPGEVLLWDNLQILHRAGGGFGDQPRLLLRTQTMYAT